RRLFPAGHRRLADGEIPRAVWDQSCTEREATARRANRGPTCTAFGGCGMSDAIIELKGVSKSFGGVIANRDISLTVPRGAITGLIGPNGSGKTTLFNSIVGYHPIDSGSIRLEGHEISHLRVQEIARIGMLRTFQTTRIFGKMNCLQNMLISIPHR